MAHSEVAQMVMCQSGPPRLAKGHQMRAGRAERERADQKGDQKCPIIPPPAGGDLHAHGIGTGQRRAREQARGKSARSADGQVEKQQIGACSQEGRNHEDKTRIATICQPQGRIDQCSGSKAKLHGCRQPGRTLPVETAGSGHFRQNGGRGKPQGQYGHLRQHQ